MGVDFFVDRSITKYLCQYYLPSAIIVFVSQISFVIPISALPGRIGLVVNQFLALTNIFINELVIIIQKAIEIQGYTIVFIKEAMLS